MNKAVPSPEGHLRSQKNRSPKMLIVTLTELLEKQYEAAVRVRPIRVATAQPDRIEQEVEVEIFGEASSRTYKEVNI